jgi:hypothetical protein
MAGKPSAAAVAAKAVERLNGPEILYSAEDCQGFVKACIKACGWSAQWAGTNDIWRNHCYERREFDAKNPGDLRPGDMLMIHKTDGNEPERYQGDGIGNINHIGIYCGASGAEVVHSAKSVGKVAASTIKNGWNRVVRLKCLDYASAAAASDPADEQGSANPSNSAKPANPGSGQVRVNGGGVRMHKQPYIEAGNVITGVPDGAILPVMDKANGWTLVRYDVRPGLWHIGYIRDDLLVAGEE